MADVQFRLYQYGHDLNEAAALRIPEFTPWVVGPTKVWNFQTWARPGLGLVLLLLAAVAVTFGPGIARRIRGLGTAGTGVAVLLIVGVLAVPANAAQEPSTGHAGAAHVIDLQALVDETAPAGHLELDPLTYHGSVVITKPLTIVGNGAILHGDGTGSVLTIEADDVRVTDVAVANSAPGPVGSPAGIEVSGKRIELQNLSVSESYVGVSVNHSNGVTLDGVLVEGRGQADLGDVDHALEESTHHRSYGRDDMPEGRGDGISILNSKRVSVRNSSVIAARDGVYLSFVSDVMLDGNEIRNGRYAIHSMYSRHVTLASNELRSNVAGIVLMYGGPMMVIDNHLAFNRSASTGFGLLVKDVAGIEAAKNVIQGNRIGVQVEGPAGASAKEQRFVLNTIALNGVGTAVLPSAAATFTGNSFVENHIQVVPVGGQVAEDVRWVDGGAGNYWSGYRGFDRQGDGVGDVPHRESGITARLLAENPSLYALLGSPALNLTITSNQKWAAADSYIVDALPLMEPHSPAAPHTLEYGGGGVILLSSLMAVIALVILGAAVGFGRRRSLRSWFIPKGVADELS
jgi:nitrous oxidase accessory protein